VTLYGYTGSTAQIYAVANSHEFVPFVEVLSKSTTSVTLKEIAGFEYQLEGGEWQDSTTFTGLTPGTVYTLYQRMKATLTVATGKQSVSLTEKTKLIAQEALSTGSDLIINEYSGYIKGIAAGKTPVQIKAEFNNPSKVRIVDKDGNVLADTANVGTGSRIQILDDAGNVIDEVIVVVKGDVTGSGTIGTLGYIRLRAFLLGTYELEGAYLEAALMINGDSAVTTLSYIRIRAYLLGSYELY
jgi:hypothetical protein